MKKRDPSDIQDTDTQTHTMRHQRTSNNPTNLLETDTDTALASPPPLSGMQECGAKPSRTPLSPTITSRKGTVFPWAGFVQVAVLFEPHLIRITQVNKGLHNNSFNYAPPAKRSVWRTVR